MDQIESFIFLTHDQTVEKIYMRFNEKYEKQNGYRQGLSKFSVASAEHKSPHIQRAARHET